MRRRARKRSRVVRVAETIRTRSVPRRRSRAIIITRVKRRSRRIAVSDGYRAALARTG